jgi:hypothetical protein
MSEPDPKPTPALWSRRQVLAAGASAGALLALGCGAGPTSGPGSGPLAGSDAQPDLGPPEISAQVWQTMGAFVRASADGATGTRVHLYNPANVASRVDLQVFSPSGQVVLKAVRWAELGPGQGRRVDLRVLLAEARVALPFAGSFWVGTQPESGEIFMGLQGIGFTWYGPAHQASAHGMRDFGNSNHDPMWTDLVLPRIRVGARYATRVSILNGSGDGVSEALTAHPHLVLRDDEGALLAEQTLELAPYASTLIDLGDLVPTDTTGTLQITEPEAGLVALGLLWDRETDGIVSADHLFDRHFVANGAGFGFGFG